jgi:hypothetical protein
VHVILGTLVLSDTGINGKIPSEIGLLSNLGKHPNWFQVMTGSELFLKLQYACLQSCFIEYFRAGSLNQRDAEYFNGTLPPEIGNCHELGKSRSKLEQRET